MDLFLIMAFQMLYYVKIKEITSYIFLLVMKCLHLAAIYKHLSI